MIKKLRPLSEIMKDPFVSFSCINKTIKTHTNKEFRYQPVIIEYMYELFGSLIDVNIINRETKLKFTNYEDIIKIYHYWVDINGQVYYFHEDWFEDYIDYEDINNDFESIIKEL